MAFVALRFDADGALAERWADALLEAGALSVDLTDPAADTPRGFAVRPAGEAPLSRRRLAVLFPPTQTREVISSPPMSCERAGI
jgi:hypothetical protein